MRIAGLIGFAVLASVLHAGSRGVERECLLVHLHGTDEMPFIILIQAEQIAHWIFNDIGVSAFWTKSVWRQAPSSCAAVEVAFVLHSPKGPHPGELAYTELSQDGRTQIYIFIDRLLGANQHDHEKVLAHVMAHEIGHALEGVARHSATGVMKAHLSASEMCYRKLRFAPEDADLIRAGLLKARQLPR